MIMLKRFLLMLLVAAVLLVVLVLSSLNPESVQLNLYFLQWQQALGLILVVAVMSGLVAGLLLAYLLWIWPLQRRCAQLKRAQHQNNSNSGAMIHD